MRGISGKNNIGQKYLSFKLDYIMHDANNKQLPKQPIGYLHGKSSKTPLQAKWLFWLSTSLPDTSVVIG